MKYIIIALLSINLMANTCDELRNKILYYQKQEKSQTYTGDFKDVIEQYKLKYNECIKDPVKFNNTQLYRAPNQQSTKQGYLF